MQSWSGTGPCVCQSCGATQPEKPGSASPGTTTTEPAGTTRRLRGTRLVASLIVVLLIIFGALLLLLRRPGHANTPELPAVALHSRTQAVNNPAIRTLPAGSDLSAVDLLRSAPANAANLFDTRLLSIANPRPMNDIDGNLWYIGEVTNHSPDRIAISPSVQMGMVKDGHVVETRDLTFSDLPPGGHAPVAFQWGGEPSEVQHMVFHWKPVPGAAVTNTNRLDLEVNVDGRTMTPGSVTVNFAYTFHFVTAKLRGTVTNRGTTVASGADLLLTLYDKKGHVTGFKTQPLSPIAPGEQIRYQIEADQWGDPVGNVDVAVLPTSQTKL